MGQVNGMRMGAPMAMRSALSQLKGERDIVTLTALCLAVLFTLSRRLRTSAALAWALALFALLKKVVLFQSGRIRRLGQPEQLAQLPVGATHYALEGPSAGPLVVLVHGFCGEMSHVASLSRELAARGMQVLRYDTIGRGYSECIGMHQPHTPELFSTQLEQLLDKLGLSSRVLNLVGYSMGGAIVAAFVRQRASSPRVTNWGRVVLIAAAGLHETPPPGLVSAPILSAGLMKLFFLRGIIASTSDDFVDPQCAPARAMEASLRERAQLEPGITRAALNTARNFPLGGLRMRPAYQALGRVILPTKILLVWGNKDLTCPPSSAKELCKVLGRPKLHWLRGGHCALQEQHSEAGAVIGDFLVGGKGLASAGSSRAGTSISTRQPADFGLHEAAQRAPIELLGDQTKAWIQSGRAVNVRDKVGATPLHQAAQRGASQMVEVLLDHGAEIEARDNAGSTVLHYCNVDSTVADLLIKAGAAIDAQDKKGRTALHRAVAHGSRKLTALLLAAGAAVDLKDHSGATALRLAKVQKHSACLKLLEAVGALDD